MAAIVSDERLKGQSASQSIFEEGAFAASAVLAFGPAVGKERAASRAVPASTAG